jgi:hypothetical protein
LFALLLIFSFYAPRRNFPQLFHRSVDFLRPPRLSALSCGMLPPTSHLAAGLCRVPLLTSAAAAKHVCVFKSIFFFFFLKSGLTFFRTAKKEEAPGLSARPPRRLLS